MSSCEKSESERAVVTTPQETVNARLLNEHLISAKSREKYNIAYDNFIQWKNKKNANSFSEDVLLAYFNDIVVKYKAGSLYSIYSMLKSTLMANNCVDIERYPKLKCFLKKNFQGYVSKKSKILTGENVKKFINEAPDDTYLATKVALILGITGALRGQDLSNITVDDVENDGETLIVKVPATKNNTPRTFVISGDYYKIVKKYQAMRSTKACSNRFFQKYRNGKCIAQVIGKNKLGRMPKEIAQYLNLPDASSYTGHTYRRTSASLLLDSADILTLKRNGSCKPSSMAKGCIDNSIKNKINISNKTESIQLKEKVTQSWRPNASSKSVQLDQKVTDSRRPIASSSLVIIKHMPDGKITESVQPCHNIITESRRPMNSSAIFIKQMSELMKEDHLTTDEYEATGSITNSVQVTEQDEQPGQSGKSTDIRTSYQSDTESTDRDSRTETRDPLHIAALHQCRFCGEFTKDCVDVTSDKPYIANNKTALILNDLSVVLDFNNDMLPKTVCRDCDASLQEMFDFVKVVKVAQDSLIDVADEMEKDEITDEIEKDEIADEVEKDEIETVVFKTECDSPTPDKLEQNDDNVKRPDVNAKFKVFTHKRKSKTDTVETMKKPKTNDVEILKCETELVIDIKEEFNEMDDNARRTDATEINTETDIKPSEFELELATNALLNDMARDETFS